MRRVPTVATRTLWASIFTDDGVIEAPGLRLEGRANIVAALDVMARLYVATQHRVHNQVVKHRWRLGAG